MAKGRKCSICAIPARSLAVDAMLLSGATVAEVVVALGGELGFSQAAAYRHARHRHVASQALSMPAPEGERPADAARLLVRTQTYLSLLLDRAEARGDDKLGVLVADKLRSSITESNALLGYDPQTYLDELDAAQGFIRSLVQAAKVNPTAVSELATAFETVGDFHNATELASVAGRYSKTN